MAAGGSAPDLLLLNGRISTMSALGEVEALAVKDGRIVSSGTSASLGALAGPSTRVVDLRRRRVIPGLIDAHCHPVKGAIAGMFACKFAFSATPDDISDALDAFFAKWPAVECVMGGRYGSDFLDKFGAEIGRPRDWLDARSRGRAVYLREDSGHNGWANSAALKMLGITRDSPDPKGGKIVRDETGEPTGILLEEADVAARLAWPDWSHEQYKEGILEMQKIAHSFGITGVIDADTNHAMLKAFKEVDSEGALSLKVAACLTTPYGHREEPLDYEHYERWRDEYAGKNVDTRFVKIYLDGVPLSDSQSACMLHPYLADPRFPSPHHGSVHIALPILAKDVTELESRGFTVKIHCCGDGSIRTALDAIQAARSTNPPEKAKGHQLSHAGLIAPDDLPRFAQLGAVADLSPYLFHPSPIVANMRKAIGELADSVFPIRDLLESGAHVCGGSDWPAGVASMDPWIGLGSMVTRMDPRGETEGALAPDQAISVEDAVKVFTRFGARAMGIEGETGTLEIGKLADLAVLDRDIFEVETKLIGLTKVEMTVCGGQIVYDQTTGA